jgi:sugar phosphate isomerase/epimerase
VDKLAVSNIAWTGNDLEVFKLFFDLGVNGVEIAPGKVAGGWDRLNVESMTNYRNQCADFGLQIPSFQAFLFGKPHLQLLGSNSIFHEFKEHMKFVSEMASTAGAKILVYGAPKSRQLIGYSYEKGIALAEQRLAELAEVCWENEVSIGLEAVPEVYGGEIIKSYRDSSSIVTKINHPGLVFHLDTGCTYLNDESIAEAIEETVGMISHFHISQPSLSNFSNPQSYHIEAAKKLNECSYDGWLCIEMLESENNNLKTLKEAVNFVHSNY